MRHSHKNFVNAVRRRAFDKLVEHRNYRFATFERKTLLPKIFFMQKLLELLGFDEFQKQFFLRFHRKRFDVNKLCADLCANPIFFLFRLNMPIFDADFAAIRFPQNV